MTMIDSEAASRKAATTVTHWCCSRYVVSDVIISVSIMSFALS